ncbi:hypothetical protein V3N99_19060 [Dermatophilaceae bacterium Soc4.6]
MDASGLNRLQPGAVRVLAFIACGTVWLVIVGVTAVVNTTASPFYRTVGAAAVFAGVLTVISF